MADWRDGVEYAPTGRPYGFATPRTEPLSAPEPGPHPAEGRPESRPSEFDAPAAPPLADLVPHTAEARDPHEAFDTGSASFTGATAWGTVAGHGPGGWNPTQPLPLSNGPASTSTDFAPPTGPPVVPAQRFAPPPPAPPQPWSAAPPPAGPYPAGYPPQQPYPGAPQPASGNRPAVPYPPAGVQPQWVPPTPQDAGRTTPLGWLLVLLLLAGAVINALSVLLLAASALIVRRVQPRRRGLVTAVSIGAGAVVPVLALAWAAEPYSWFETGSSVSQVICFVLLVATTITLAVGGSRR